MVNYSFSLLTFEYFLLVLVRITSFVFSAPFFSMSNTPGRVKIGFSVFVSILLIGVLPESTIEYGGVIEYATIVVKEGITGYRKATDLPNFCLQNYTPLLII